MLMQSCDGGGALLGVAYGQDEAEGFRRWAGGEEFVDEAAANSEPDTAGRRWWSSASIVLGNRNSEGKNIPVGSCHEHIHALGYASVLAHPFWLLEVVFVVNFRLKRTAERGYNQSQHTMENRS